MTENLCPIISGLVTGNEGNLFYNLKKIMCAICSWNVDAHWFQKMLFLLDSM